MISIFRISGSALLAQSQRMNVTASNLANADSVADPSGRVYRPRHVVFQTLPLGGAAAGDNAHGIGGVGVAAVLESQAAPRMEYQPYHPLADEQGYVARPAVDPVAEMVDMISASRAYQANVEVVNTTRSLMTRTLTMGQ